MPGRLFLLFGLFPRPLPHARAIDIRHDREAGPRLLCARARAGKRRGDIASTVVFDDRERDKISWIRVRGLPK